MRKSLWMITWTLVAVIGFWKNMVDAGQTFYFFSFLVAVSMIYLGTKMNLSKHSGEDLLEKSKNKNFKKPGGFPLG